MEKAEVPSLEESLRALGSSADVAAGMRLQPVMGVDGAFVIQNCLSEGECGALAAAVRLLHSSWREAQETKHLAKRARGQELNVTADRESSPSSSAEVTAEVATVGAAVGAAAALPRRMSQHHIPCRVAQDALACLCARMRPFLPRQAGPDNAGPIMSDGRQVSPFLRCYHYKEGDTSTPHYDKSFTEHYRGPRGPTGLEVGPRTPGTVAGGPRGCGLDGGPEVEDEGAGGGGGGGSGVRVCVDVPAAPALVEVAASASSNGGGLDAVGSGLRATQEKQSKGGQSKYRVGQIQRFSAYSVLLYLNDDFDGGETTFFQHDPAIRISRRGLAPHAEDLDKLRVAARVEPRRGDVLVFPHGKFSGCHPDPLHEGSLIRRGEKLLIRTDLVFAAPPVSSQRKARKRKKKKKEKTTTTMTPEREDVEGKGAGGGEASHVNE